jgi:hypothetical protein
MDHPGGNGTLKFAENCEGEHLESIGVNWLSRGHVSTLDA